MSLKSGTEAFNISMSWSTCSPARFTVTSCHLFLKSLFLAMLYTAYVLLWYTCLFPLQNYYVDGHSTDQSSHTPSLTYSKC